MAATFLSSGTFSTNEDTAPNPVTTSITVPAGANVLVISMAENDAGGEKYFSMTLGGAAPTVVQTRASSGGGNTGVITAAWATTPGSKTLSVVGDTGYDGYSGAWSAYTSDATGALVGGAFTAESPGGANPTTGALAIDAGAIAVAGVRHSSTSNLPLAVGTNLGSFAFFNTGRAAYRVGPGAISWTDAGSERWAIAGLVVFGAAPEGDTTAPTLSSPTGTGGTLTASGSVSTNESGGTLYAVLTASATTPTAAQIKAGQDHTGAAALRAVSQAVSATGVQNIVSAAATAGTPRHWHYTQDDGASPVNTATPVSSASFVVAASGPSPATTVSLTLTTDGTTPAASLTGLKWAYWDVVTPDLMTTAPLVKGSAGTTNGSGVFTQAITGTTKTVGQVGYLIVTNSDGTTSQGAALKGFAGPATVS